MIEYFDSFGKKIQDDDFLLVHRDDGAFVNIISQINGLLYCCNPSYYGSEQGRQALHEVDLSKVSVFDIDEFNRQFKKTGVVRYVDTNGIEIHEGMCLFIGSIHSGCGVLVTMHEGELSIESGTERNPYFESLAKVIKNQDFDFIVTFIPDKYLHKNNNKRNEGYIMKKFNGLVCSGCGSELDLAVSYDGLDNKAVDYDKRFSPNWGYEIELVCSKCGRAYGICRTDKDSHISEITHE